MFTKRPLSFGQNQSRQRLQLHSETKERQIIGPSTFAKYLDYLPTTSWEVRSWIIGKLIRKHHWRIFKPNRPIRSWSGKISLQVIHENVPQGCWTVCQRWLWWRSLIGCCWMFEDIYSISWCSYHSREHCRYGNWSYNSLWVYFLIRFSWLHRGYSDFT